jgi:hypothetical protein
LSINEAHFGSVGTHLVIITSHQRYSLNATVKRGDYCFAGISQLPEFIDQSALFDAEQ